MSISAYDSDERLLLKRIYYSIGGGFVVTDTELEAMRNSAKNHVTEKVPYPFATAKQMLDMARGSGLSIAAMKRANELTKNERRGTGCRPGPHLGGHGELYRSWAEGLKASCRAVLRCAVAPRPSTTN